MMTHQIPAQNLIAIGMMFLDPVSPSNTTEIIIHHYLKIQSLICVDLPIAPLHWNNVDSDFTDFDLKFEILIYKVHDFDLLLIFP